VVRQVARSGRRATAGTRRVSGLRADAAIDRDERGVPTVRASCEEDLYFALGYAQATDRLWQMDVLRRRAAGTLSAVLGPSLVAEDTRWRRLALARVSRASLALTDERTRANLEAFSAGVNAIAGSRWWLPPEFLLLRYRPRPWTPLDSVMVVKQLGFELGLNLRHEVFRGQDMSADLAAHLRVPRYPADGPVTVRAHGGPVSPVELPEPSRVWLADLLDGPGERAVGSNAWAVAGSRTASGAPLLANDPHVAFTQPSLWYQVGLEIGDHTGYGVTVPGIPGLIAGASRDLAWGITNSWADTQDLATDPPPASWQEDGVVEVRGGDPVPVTASGGDGWVAYGDDAGLFWSGCTPSAEIQACQRMWRAESYVEFRDVLRSFGVPVLNVVVAGRDGTIAVKTAGRVPDRTRGSGLAPAPFESVASSWREFVPFDALPESVDPPEGYLVSANNKLLPDDASPDLGGDWMPPYRAARIEELIATTPKVTAADCARWQTDDLNGRARLLLPLVLPSMPTTTAGKACQEILSTWDCHDRGDLAAPLVFTHLMFAVADAWFGPLAATAPDLVLQVDHLVRDPSAVESLGLPPLAATVAESLDTIGAALTEQFGAPSSWRYDDVHRITDPHPLGQGGAALRAVFCTPPTPVGGSNQTVGLMAAVREGHVVEGAPWRMVAELTPEGPHVHDVLRHGASGHPASPHYDDQTAQHIRGELSPVHHPPTDGTSLNLRPRRSLSRTEYSGRTNVDQKLV
jgi:penicillin amidase